MPPPVALLVGGQYGRFTVLSSLPDSLWRVRCSCGQERTVTSGIARGKPLSCGCARRGKRPSNKRHGRGADKSGTYKSWLEMRARCLNETNAAYARYGGAGVSIATPWSRFETFLADMGERPPGKTLDRFPDPHGNYEPSNCRWATPEEQNRNRRNVISADMIDRIKQLRAAGTRRKDLSVRFNISLSSVDKILGDRLKGGVSWRR